MAKRRKLQAPTADDLDKIEAEFRSETSSRLNSAAAPIAQVAADAAAQSVADPKAREEAARNKADAERLKEAEAAGLVIHEIPLSDIMDDAMIRDRVSITEEELTELKLSIAAHGLRLPIEVFERAKDGQGPRYGLLSGYRRYRAFRDLLELTENAKYKTIKAIVRDPDAMGGSYVAMVEENEVRASLSHFERGRIAVVAANQGAFANTEAAVDSLFASASKSKRSKVRSFALIFEELGDLLQFPESLKEREGLRLANALRQGAEKRIRELLGSGQRVSTPEEEWGLIEAALGEVEAQPKDKSRGGRPSGRPIPPVGWVGNDTLRLSSGVVLQKQVDSQGYLIRLTGQPVDAATVDAAMIELQRLFEAQ